MKFPIPGDKKVKRKFLLWPQGPEKDTRWLEWVNVEYMYRKVQETSGPVYRWVPNRFVT